VGDNAQKIVAKFYNLLLIILACHYVIMEAFSGGACVCVLGWEGGVCVCAHASYSSLKLLTDLHEILYER
jgi:hypothetical protein